MGFAGARSLPDRLAQAYSKVGRDRNSTLWHMRQAQSRLIDGTFAIFHLACIRTHIPAPERVENPWVLVYVCQTWLFRNIGVIAGTGFMRELVCP